MLPLSYSALQTLPPHPQPHWQRDHPGRGPQHNEDVRGVSLGHPRDAGPGRRHPRELFNGYEIAILAYSIAIQ